MRIVVRKYGGSSLATAGQIRAVAERIGRLRRCGYAPVVVVSARGDHTDELLGQAAEVGGSGPSREVDQLLATGENAAAALLAIALHRFGVPAASLTGPQAGIEAAGPPGAGRIAAVRPDRVTGLLAEGAVPVVAGFQGATGSGDVLTLGRGGSDTTAVALAAALRLDRCEIYTDVDGVYTADPRLVPDARIRPALGAADMGELARAGAQVLHPRAVELAAAAGVAVHVGNARDDRAGTVVHSGEESGGIAGVAHEPDVAWVSVRRCPPAAVLGLLGEWEVPVDFFSHARFIVRRADLAPVREPLSRLAAGGVAIDGSVGTVSLVGRDLRTRVAARVHALLAGRGIAAAATAIAPRRVSVVVPKDRVPDAVRVLHAGFGLHHEDGAA